MKKFNPDGFALFGRAGRDRNSDEQRSNEQGPIQGSQERSSEEVDDLGQAEMAFQKAAMELLEWPGLEELLVDGKDKE